MLFQDGGWKIILQECWGISDAPALGTRPDTLQLGPAVRVTLANIQLGLSEAQVVLCIRCSLQVSRHNAGCQASDPLFHTPGNMRPR